VALFRRSRFHDVIVRQLDLFLEEHRDVIEECDERLAAYNAAERDEAEELYGDYVDELDALADALREMRAVYAARLSKDDALRYEREFTRAATRRLSRFALDLDD
jgi:hypothetical protein